MIDRRESIELLARAVSIPSPSGGEADLAKYLQSASADLGAQSFIDEVGNVHALFGSHDEQPVMLMSHLDTVDAGVARFYRTQDEVYGRGAVDAKGPLIAMLVACANTAARYPTHWVGVVEEETVHSRGAEHLRRSVEVPRCVIVGEPTGSGSVGIAYKGKADVVATVRTPASHSTSPLPHASDVAVEAISRLLAQHPPKDRARFDVLSFALLEAHLGLHESHMQLGFRIPPEMADEQIIEITRRAFDASLVRVELTHSVPAVSTARTSQLAKALAESIRTVTGDRTRFVRKTATCDMNTLAQSWSCPMAVYGPGDSALDHADDEHVRVDEFLRAVDVLSTAIPLLYEDGVR